MHRQKKNTSPSKPTLYPPPAFHQLFYLHRDKNPEVGPRSYRHFPCDKSDMLGRGLSNDEADALCVGQGIYDLLAAGVDVHPVDLEELADALEGAQVGGS